jgi:hypothetical protein
MLDLNAQTRRFAWLALLLAALPASARADNAAEARAVLSASATAVGEPRFSSVKFVRLKATIATAGLKGSYETFYDSKTGAYWSFEDFNVDKEHDGYDGKSVWQQDGSGQVAIQGTDDDVKAAVNTAFQNIHGYFHADTLKAEISYAGRKQEGTRSFDVVRITPKDGRPFDLWIDTKTHLPDRWVEQGAIHTNTTFFSDYRAVSGVQMPFKLHQTNGQTKYDSEIEADSIAFEDRAPDGIFSPPPPPKPDFGFAGNDRSTTMPFKLINNHMYVEVRLNGQGPFEFLFDTGGSNVITPTIARQLGLKPEGAFQGNGSGEKSQDVGLVKVAREDIGGAHLDNQVFAVIALESFSNVEGKPITGIFGYEVFKRLIVKTDYEHHQIVLSDPKGWVYAGTGTRTAFKLKDVIPVVEGDIDGVKGNFQLDTGSRASLDLLTPFVEHNNLAAKYKAQLSGIDGWGLGGASRSWFVRAHRFTFGGVTVEGAVVGLSRQKSGDLTDIYTAGNVGAGILKRFNITWDYPHNQIFFEKNANYADPDVFDRAGIWVNLADTGFEVVDVVAGGPAAEAGLKVGDRILAVDGRKAGNDISLYDFRLRLKEKPGTKVKLDVARGDQTLTITLALRELV